MEVQRQSQQLAQMLTPHQHSAKLIDTLIKLELPEARTDAKMELVTITSDLMPEGRPKFLDVVKYPKITDLVRDHGRKKMLKVLFLLVKDFCNSINVVRNMNEDQMIEAAAMLLDEAGNFRLEDYTMFFAMAKRGSLGKIMDRIDTQVISTLLDEYWIRRKNAGEMAVETEIKHIDSLGRTMRIEDTMNPMDARLNKSADGLAGAIGELKNRFKEWKEEEK